MSSAVMKHCESTQAEIRVLLLGGRPIRQDVVDAIMNQLQGSITAVAAEEFALGVEGRE